MSKPKSTRPKPVPFPLPDEPFYSGVICLDLQKRDSGRRWFKLLLGNHAVRIIFKGISYKLQFKKFSRRNQVSTGIKTEAGALECAVCHLREQMRSTPPLTETANSAT